MTSVCSDPVALSAKGTGPERDAVKWLSRSRDGAAFTEALCTKTEFDLGSCFPRVTHMEEASSGYLEGMLLMLLADAVRLLRNGSEADA